jgi:membrane protease YdiL (CAAX protease family)
MSKTIIYLTKFKLIFIITSILAPISEETLFRGLIFSKIEANQTTKIILSSFFFSLLHFQLNVIIPLFIIGIILGKLRVTQNSIWVPIIFHALNNSLATYAEFFI